MSTFQAFPHIEGFHNVYKGLRRYFDSALPAVVYRGKIKLHGTNAAVRIDPDGSIHCQKRSGDCTPENDNAGFAAWVESEIHYFRKLKLETKPLVLHGEWAGPGIQKGVAVSEIPERCFFIFAVQLGERIISSPDFISGLLCVTENSRVKVLPWHTQEILVNFSSQEKCSTAAEFMNYLVSLVDQSDSYIKEAFGVDGHGEGIVFTPVSQIAGSWDLTPQLYGSYVFKVKGASHSKSKAAKPAKVGAMSSPSAFAFASEFVTEDRLEQALREGCNGVAEKRNTGAFLKWIGNDIQREGADELEASALEWKEVASLIATQASRWFLARCENFNIEQKEAA